MEDRVQGQDDDDDDNDGTVTEDPLPSPPPPPVQDMDEDGVENQMKNDDDNDDTLQFRYSYGSDEGMSFPDNNQQEVDEEDGPATQPQQSQTGTEETTDGSSLWGIPPPPPPPPYDQSSWQPQQEQEMHQQDMQQMGNPPPYYPPPSYEYAYGDPTYSLAQQDLIASLQSHVHSLESEANMHALTVSNLTTTCTYYENLSNEYFTKLDAVEEELRAAKVELDRMELVRGEWEEEVKGLENTVEELKEKLEEAEIVCDRLEEEQRSSLEEQSTLQTIHEETQSQLEELATTIEQNRIESLRKEILDKTRHKSSFWESFFLFSSKKKTRSQIDKERLLQAQQLSRDTLIRALNDTREHVDELQVLVDALEVNNTLLMEQVTSRCDLIEELNDRIDVFEEDRVVMKAALRQLRKEMKVEESRSRVLEEELGRKDQEINKLKQVQTNFQQKQTQEIQNLQTQLLHSNETLINQTRTISEIEMYVDKLEERLASLAMARKMLLDEKEQQLSDEEKEKEGIDAIVEQVKEEMEIQHSEAKKRLGADIEYLKEELDGVLKDKHEVQTQLVNVMDQTERLLEKKQLELDGIIDEKEKIMQQKIAVEKEMEKRLDEKQSEAQNAIQEKEKIMQEKIVLEKEMDFLHLMLHQLQTDLQQKSEPLLETAEETFTPEDEIAPAAVRGNVALVEEEEEHYSEKNDSDDAYSYSEEEDGESESVIDGGEQVGSLDTQPDPVEKDNFFQDPNVHNAIDDEQGKHEVDNEIRPDHEDDDKHDTQEETSTAPPPELPNYSLQEEEELVYNATNGQNSSGEETAAPPQTAVGNVPTISQRPQSQRNNNLNVSPPERGGGLAPHTRPAFHHPNARHSISSNNHQGVGPSRQQPSPRPHHLAVKQQATPFRGIRKEFAKITGMHGFFSSPHFRRYLGRGRVTPGHSFNNREPSNTLSPNK